MATATIPGAPTNLSAVADAPVSSGSLAAGLGTPSFQDLFNYTSASSSAFTNNWVLQDYTAKNYAGAGSTVSMLESNLSFPINANTGAPCLCITLNQPSAGVSNGSEILSAASLFASTGLGGYGTYEFCARFGSTSSTPTGTGVAVSGGVSSTFIMSENNSGGENYVEIDAPECEGQNPTWAQYDTWYNSNSSGNTEPTGGNFIEPPGWSEGVEDTYIVVPTAVTGFNYYGFVWSAGLISYYINGVFQGTNTKNIPTPESGENTPGIDINHYGCNSKDWGGTATVGTPRYLYVQSVKFWAA